MANNITQIPATVETGLDQPLTDAQLRATPVAVSATLTPSGTQDVNIIQVNGDAVTSLPVNDNDGSLTVDGTVAVSSSALPTGAATEATLSTLNAKVTAVNTGAVVVSSSALPSGASTSALQTSGNASLSSIDAKLTNPLPVSGTVTANTGLSQPLTDTQLRATPVPVSGTIATGGLTDTQLRATPVPVSGTVTSNAGTNLNTSLLALESGGNLAAIKADVDKIPSQGQALAAASMPVVLPATQITALTPPAAITGFNLEATQLLVKAKTDNLDVALSTRLKPADTLTGVTTVGSVTAITNALPSGTNILGKVGIDQTTPGTTNGVQVNAALPAGTNVIGHVINDSGSTTAVTGNVTVVQPTGTNLHSVIDSGVITSVTSITNALPAGINLLGKTGIDQTTPGTTNKVSIGTDGTVAVSGNVAVTNAGLTNIDVLLSTRTKPADQQHTIIDSGTTAVTQAAAANLNMTEASAAAILATLGLLTLTQGVLGTSTVGPMMQGLVNDLPNSYLPNYVQPLSLTSDGRLRVTSVSSDINKVWNNTFESPFFDENMFVGNSIYF